MWGKVENGTCGHDAWTLKRIYIELELTLEKVFNKTNSWPNGIKGQYI
jgi:hypothetical protein